MTSDSVIVVASVAMEWVGAIGVVGAALITGVFTVIASRFRRELTVRGDANTVRMEGLVEDVAEVKADVKEVRKDFQRHLEWHANVKTRRVNTGGP